MRLLSGEKSAVSQPSQPSRLTARRLPLASTRSGGPTLLSVTVTRSTVGLPVTGTTHTTGAALLGASSCVTTSREDACQHPTHGVQRASADASWVFCAPARPADPSSRAAATIARL